MSPGTRLVAVETKATKRPSALMATTPLPPFPWFPVLSTLTRSVVPVCRSWTNTSEVPLVSPGTRLVDLELKATKRPLALIKGLSLSEFPWFPAPSTLMRSVIPVCRSWTNTSDRPLVSPGTRLVARESKATKRPSALIDGGGVGPSGGGPICSFPALSTLTRSVVWADAPVGVARSTRTPARRPTRAIHREGASERDVRASAVLMVASFGVRAPWCS